MYLLYLTSDKYAKNKVKFNLNLFSVFKNVQSKIKMRKSSLAMM